MRIMKYNFKKTGLIVILPLWALPGLGQSVLKLCYDKSAVQWEETLPLGNGRLGMTPDGGIEEETIVLNDITLWSGAPQDANNYEAYKKLPAIRQLLIEGKNDEAQRLIDKDFVCLGKGGGDEPFGCFQTLGNLRISYSYGGEKVSKEQVQNYSRELDLDEAMARTSFTCCRQFPICGKNRER